MEVLKTVVLFGITRDSKEFFRTDGISDMALNSK